MGTFDDLIPGGPSETPGGSAGGGLFDDLIPAAEAKSAPAPNTTTEQPGFVERAFVRPAQSALAGYHQGASGMYHLFGNIAEGVNKAGDYLTEKTGAGIPSTSPESGFGQARQWLKAAEENEAARAGEAMPTAPGLPEKIYAGLGQAAVDLPVYAAGISVAGPVLGMGAIDAARAADKGGLAAAEAGAKGLLLGGLVHGLAPFTAPVRVGAMGTAGAAQAVGEGGDAQDVTASAVLMGLLSLPGSGSVRLRDLVSRKSGVAPDQITPEHVSATAADPEVSAELKRLMEANGISDAADPRVPQLQERLDGRRGAEAARAQLPTNVDMRRVRAEQERVDLGEIDPAAASTAGYSRPTSPDVIQVGPSGMAVPYRDGELTPEARAINEGVRLRGGQPNKLPVVTEPQVRPMTDEQVIQARKSMETPNQVPAGETMTGYADLEPRLREDAIRHVGDIRDRIGEDPIGLVRGQLGLTENDFIRMSPDARERVVAAAQRQRGTETPGATLHTADAALSGREGFTPAPGGRPDATGEGIYSPATKPEPGRPGAYQPTDVELDAAGKPYARTAAGTSDRPFKMGSTDGIDPEQARFFQDRAEAQARAERAQSEEELLRRWRDYSSQRESTGRGPDFDARSKYEAKGQSKTFSTKEAKPDAEGRFGVDEFGFVKSDKGGPVIFADQKQAARWILNVGQKNSPDQIFEIANHPSGKGFTVVERGRVQREGPSSSGPKNTADPSVSASSEPISSQPRQLGAPPIRPRDVMPGAEPRRGYTQADTVRDMAPPEQRAPERAAPEVSDRGSGRVENNEGDRVVDSQPATQDVGSGWRPNPDLPPPSLPPKAAKVNQAAGSQAELERSLRRVDETKNQPRLDRDQKTAAEEARYETLSRFTKAEAGAGPRGDAANNHVAGMAKKYAERERGRFLEGWDDAVAGKIDTDQTNSRNSYRWDGSYSAGADAAQKWRDGNPGQPERVTVEGVTARGRTTKYDLPNDRATIADVKDRVSKLPLDRFYSNPLDPKLVKDLLLDPAIRVLRSEMQAIRRDVKAMQAAPHDLASPNRKALHRRVADAARAIGFSNRGMFKTMAARYGDTHPEAAELVREMMDHLGTDPGAGRTVKTTFEEAVDRHGLAPQNRLRNIIAKHLEDQAFQDNVRDLLTGTTAKGTADEKRVAAAVRKLLDEHHDYVDGALKEGGAEGLGKRKNYFPRIADEAKVLADPAGFKQAAERAYRAEGLDAETAKQAAEDWFGRIAGHVSDPEFGVGPSNRHTKGRELGPRADAILRDYYVTDLGPALSYYFHQTARTAEFTRRFGKNGAKADQMFADMRRLGMTEGDVGLLEGAFNSSVGRMRTSAPDWMLGVSQWVQTAGTISLLPRAVLSSIAEPLAVGVRANDVRAGLNAFIDTIRAGMGSGKMEDAREIAEGLGIVGDAVQQMILAQRWGGGLSDRHALIVGGMKISPARVTQKFFEKNVLTSVTEAQRIAATRAGQGVVASLLRDVAKPGRAASARSLLAELGIAPDDVSAVKAWLDRAPPASEITASTAREADLYRTAIGRFVDESIQNPKAVDRPALANHPIARMGYSIMSFSYAYSRNVLFRSSKQLRMAMTGKTGLGETLTAGERLRVLGLAPAMGALLAGQWAMSNVREALYNPSGATERKKEPIKDWVLAMDRGGMFGAASPLVNGFLSVRYERDLSNILVGANAAYFLENGAKIAGLTPEPFGKNSPNTNTAEWNAARAAYRLATPAVNGALALMPGGPVITKLSGAAMMATSSPEASAQFANSLVGEKNKRGGGRAIQGGGGIKGTGR